MLLNSSSFSIVLLTSEDNSTTLLAELTTAILFQSIHGNDVTTCFHVVYKINQKNMAAGIGGRFVPLGELQEDEEKDQNTSNQEMVLYIRFWSDQLIYNLIKVISLLNEAMLLSKDEKMERLAKVCSLVY